MSNAIEVIDQEIDEISQMLKHHAYQLQVLRNLREKLDESTGKLAIEWEGGRERIREQFEPQEKRERVKMTDAQVLKYARKLARKIRNEGGTKHTHMLDLWREGKLTYEEREYLDQKIQPAKIGHDEYNKIFKGTKYAK